MSVKRGACGPSVGEPHRQCAWRGWLCSECALRWSHWVRYSSMSMSMCRGHARSGAFERAGGNRVGEGQQGEGCLARWGADMLACGHHWAGKSTWTLGPTKVDALLSVFVCERLSVRKGRPHVPNVCLVQQAVLSFSGAALVPAVSVLSPTGNVFCVKCAPFLMHHFVFSAGGASAPAALPSARPQELGSRWQCRGHRGRCFVSPSVDSVQAQSAHSKPSGLPHLQRPARPLCCFGVGGWWLSPV